MTKLEEAARNDPIKIGIITFYRSQVGVLQGEIDKLKSRHKLVEIGVDTVDAFQGREADVIVVSSVLQPSSTIPNLSEFLSDQRLNVALTRAKDYLFVFMSDELAKSEVSGSWGDLVENAGRRGTRRPIKNLKVEIKEIFEGPNTV